MLVLPFEGERFLGKKTRGIRETVYVDLHKVLKNLALVSKMKTCSLGEFRHSRHPCIYAYLIGIDLWIHFSSEIV